MFKSRKQKLNKYIGELNEYMCVPETGGVKNDYI